MLKKTTRAFGDGRLRRVLFLLLALLALAAIGAAAYLLRPLTIVDGARATQLRMKLNAPLLKTGEALYAAGIWLDPADRVTPALDQPIPLTGVVRVERAAYLTLWEGGQARSIPTFANTITAAMADSNTRLQPGDRLLRNGLEVDPATALQPGDRLVLQVERAAPFSALDEEGEKTANTRAATVARALWDAGVRLASGDTLSVPAGSPLAAGGEPPVLTRARAVTIRAGEAQPVTVFTTASTVGQALADARVGLQGLDYSLPAEGEPVPEEGAIRVVRVREELVFEQELTPYESTTQLDGRVELDTTRVVQAGQNGIKVSRFRVRYEDGAEISRGLDSDWVAAEPKPEIIGIGTSPVERTLDTPDGTITYWRAVSVYATGYSPCRIGIPDTCSYKTASGATLTKGIIAVSFSWYPLMVGQQVYVPGYGFGTIADKGGGIPGKRWIDLGYDDDNFVGGARTVTMYFLSPIPANVPWSLP